VCRDVCAALEHIRCPTKQILAVTGSMDQNGEVADRRCELENRRFFDQRPVSTVARGHNSFAQHEEPYAEEGDS
jgi:hypothetical protein